MSATTIETEAWPLAKIETLTAMWTSGKTKSEIAAHFGTSPHAVTGKAYRLGLSKKKSNTPKTHKPVLPATKTHLHINRVSVRPERDLPPVHSPNSRVWTDRGSNECIFPIGIPERPAMQISCCNRVEAHHRYCADHRKRMYQHKK